MTHVRRQERGGERLRVRIWILTGRGL